MTWGTTLCKEDIKHKLAWTMRAFKVHQEPLIYSLTQMRSTYFINLPSRNATIMVKALAGCQLGTWWPAPLIVAKVTPLYSTTYPPTCDQYHGYASKASGPRVSISLRFRFVRFYILLKKFICLYNIHVNKIFYIILYLMLNK